MILTPVCTQQGEADTWCPYPPFSVKHSNQQAIKMRGQGWKRGILMIHSAFGKRECCDFSQQSQKLRVRKDHKKLSNPLLRFTYKGTSIPGYTSGQRKRQG